MIENFSLERVNPAPASFDPAKLLAFQLEYLRRLPLADKVAGVLPFLERAGLIAHPVGDDTRAQVARIVEALGDRLRVFGDILLQATFFFGEDVTLRRQGVRQARARAGRRRAAGGLPRLARARDAFDAAGLEAGTKEFVEARGMGMGDIVHAVRVATTGTAIGPGLFDCLSILGKDLCLRRIDRALASPPAPQPWRAPLGFTLGAAGDGDLPDLPDLRSKARNRRAERQSRPTHLRPGIGRSPSPAALAFTSAPLRTKSDPEIDRERSGALRQEGGAGVRSAVAESGGSVVPPDDSKPCCEGRPDTRPALPPPKS